MIITAVLSYNIGGGVMKNMKKIGDYLYDESQALGRGSYGSVYLGINSKTKDKVAVKVVSL
jgi:serine/threonine protein kinase